MTHSGNFVISFCAACDKEDCAINRYECQRYAATGEFLNEMQNLPAGERPVLTMQDFFADNECEWFLDNFTETAFPIEQRNIAPAGLRKSYDWPRRLSRKVKSHLWLISACTL